MKFQTAYLTPLSVGEGALCMRRWLAARPRAVETAPSLASGHEVRLRGLIQTLYCLIGARQMDRSTRDGSLSCELLLHPRSGFCGRGHEGRLAARSPRLSHSACQESVNSAYRLPAKTIRPPSTKSVVPVM